jgi:hypothetical protein
MNNAVCMCSTSESYSNYIIDWKNKLSNYNSFLIIDKSKNNNFNSNDFLYTESDIRKNLNFHYDVSKKHYWNSYGNRNIIWFYAHFRMINFYLTHNNFDYYWFFDDDVHMDNWQKFIDSTNNYDYDFMSYFCFKKHNVESMTNIPCIDSRTTSGHMWFERFPGYNDTLPKTNEYFGSFFPTVRYSNKAMRKLIEIHNSGYFGYSEGFVPTVLNLHNFSLKSIINPDNSSDMFDINDINILHKNIRITWQWI